MAGTNKRRSRRLRKKLHVGEFMELGFEFSAALKEPLDADVEEALVMAFLDEVIEPQDLAFAGWVLGGFVVRGSPGSATDEQRMAVQSWLAARPEYASVEVGPLRDAWN